MIRMYMVVGSVLVLACSSQQATSTGAGGSGTGGFGDRGVGGQGPGGVGGEGPGGLGGNSADLCAGSTSGCVSSCTTAPFLYGPSATCEAGTWTCADGWVPLSTCDLTSCAQHYQYCCDDTTGATSPAPCSSDGEVQALACPDGTHYSRRSCIPAILGDTNCADLDQKPCDLEGQQCYASVASRCTCRTTPGTDAGLVWECPAFIP